MALNLSEIAVCWVLGGAALAAGGCLDATHTGLDGGNDGGSARLAGDAAPASTDAAPANAADATVSRAKDADAALHPIDDDDAGPAPSDAHCPTDLPGPVFVEVPAPNGVSYCVDATEVSRADYALFADANSGAPDQATPCQWNTTFVPPNWTTLTHDAQPMVDVDWCDAAAYCAWAGKRLCGAIGGGAVEYNHYADPKQSQWYNACSAGGAHIYAYGDIFRANTCNGYEHGAGGPVAVGQMIACEGGYPGLFDMSGNVEEWEDSCTASTGGDDQCQFRGGSYNDSKENYRLDCDFAANSSDWFGTRASSGSNLGFRCCGD